MATYPCETCKFRAKYDGHPKSALGRFWRWHIMKRLILSLIAVTAMVSVGVAQSIYPDGYEPESCTSIMVGRLASDDGSVYTSHTCDGVSHTWISMEPAQDHRKGEMFEVFKGTRHTRFKGDTTGLRKVGEIPLGARHTYAYVNTGYPSLNEKQLAIGESTFTGPDTLINKESIFLIEELARLALMRCDNARDAIRLMGTTAEKYGYGDTGECLTVADKKEVWAFEIVGCGRDKVGAVWVAQRVPDDEISVSCNIPRIGKIDRKDKDRFMASDNVESVAKEYGLWDGQGDFVWYKAYNVPRAKGKNYAIRDWFIFNHFAPSLGLSMDDPELPFSIKPEKKLSLRDINKILRSTYEGTEYDMTRNWKSVAKGDTIVSPLANPWLTTETRTTLNTIAPGTIDFVRTVAVCWCSYSTVIQLRSWMPDEVGGILWYGVDNPGQSPRIPIFCGGRKLPHAFDNCGQKQYVPDCILWQFRRPNRLGTVAWQTNKDLFEKNILEMEDLAIDAVNGLGKTRNPDLLDSCTEGIYHLAVARWNALEEQLWIKHGRGF